MLSTMRRRPHFTKPTYLPDMLGNLKFGTSIIAYSRRLLQKSFSILSIAVNFLDAKRDQKMGIFSIKVNLHMLQVWYEFEIWYQHSCCNFRTFSKNFVISSIGSNFMGKKGFQKWTVIFPPILSFLHNT